MTTQTEQLNPDLMLTAHLFQKNLIQFPGENKKPGLLRPLHLFPLPRTLFPWILRFYSFLDSFPHPVKSFEVILFTSALWSPFASSFIILWTPFSVKQHLHMFTCELQEGSAPLALLLAGSPVLEQSLQHTRQPIFWSIWRQTALACSQGSTSEKVAMLLGN